VPPSMLDHKPLSKHTTAPLRPVKVTPEGVVVAIVAVTGVVDLVNDILVPGAFAETLRRRTPKFCLNHSLEQPIGRVLHIEEWMPGDPRLPKVTKDGQPWPAEAGALVATMQANMRVPRAREAWEMIRFYAETNEAEFSVGYKAKRAMKRRDGVRQLLSVDLFEVSHVLFGAAPLTTALSVKAAPVSVLRARRITAVPWDDIEAKTADTNTAADDAAEIDDMRDEALAMDEDTSSEGLTARLRSAANARQEARRDARRARDVDTLDEMDRRDEWDRAVEDETLREMRRRSDFRRRRGGYARTRVQKASDAAAEDMRRREWSAKMRELVRVERARRRQWNMDMRHRRDKESRAINSIGAESASMEAKTAAAVVLEAKGMGMYAGSAGEVSVPALTGVDAVCRNSKPCKKVCADCAAGGLERKGGREHCNYCDKYATKRVLWAEGMAYIPTCDGCENRAHAAIEREGDEVSGVKPLEYKGHGAQLVAAGLAVRAADTGRVLMLQRSLDEGDPAAGTWEFPGGHIEDGEDPLAAAIREWQEETGATLPALTRVVGAWDSPNGVYRGFVAVVPNEEVLTINADHEDRRVLNPDDPDGDNIEVAAWWSVPALPDMPALRPECRDTPWELVATAGQVEKKTVRWAIAGASWALARDTTAAGGRLSPVS